MVPVNFMMRGLRRILKISLQYLNSRKRGIVEPTKMPKKPKKALKIIITLLIIVLVVASGVSAYYFYNKAKDAKNEMDDTKVESDEAKSEYIEYTATSEGAGGCDSDLTEDEKVLVEDWETYTSEEYAYSIKYPADWNVDESYPENVTISGDDGSMQIRTDEATRIGFAEYTIDTESETLVDCIDSTMIQFMFDANGRLIVTQTEIGSDTMFLFMFSYEYSGASFAADMVELNDLMIKTVVF